MGSDSAWLSGQGVEDVIHAFLLEIREDRNSHLAGSYLDKSHGATAKRQPVRRITMAKVDKSAYRMEIEGNCWNAGVMEDGTLARLLERRTL